MSGLDFQVVDVPFTKGLDTHTQNKLVIPGNWTDLLNLSLSDDNTPRLRDGMSALVAAGHGHGLARYNDELLTINGPTLSSVSTAAASAIAASGRLGNVGISKTEVRRSYGMNDLPDCASGGGYTCYIWRARDEANTVVGINYTLVDENTGSKVINNAALRTSALIAGARVVYFSSAFYLFYSLGTSLYCTVIATATPTTPGAEVALITSASYSGGFIDAIAFEPSTGTPGVMVVYTWNDGTTSVRTIQVIRTGTVPSINAGPTNIFTQANVTVASVTAVACAQFLPASANSAGIFVTCRAGVTPGLTAARINQAYAVADGPTNLEATISTTAGASHLTAAPDSTLMRVFRDYQSEWGTNALSQIVARSIDTGLTTINGPTNVIPSATFAGAAGAGPQGPFIHGKAFTSGGRIFLPVFIGGVYQNLGAITSNPRTLNSQNTFFVLDTGAAGAAIAAGVVVAKALYGSYGFASFNGTVPAVSTPCGSPEVSSGVFATLAGEVTLLELTTDLANLSPIGLVRISMAPNFSLPPSRQQLGESTYVAGGSLSSYDGEIVAEHGFPVYPEGVDITVSGAGGAMTAGVHQVCFVYECVDGAGQRHQSAPSPVIQVTTVLNDSLSCIVPSLLLSQRPDIFIVPYMTEAGGLLFHRVMLNNSVFNPEPNVTNATSVTFIIDDSDATIAGNELLYTQPNQAGTTLANVAPGPVDAVTVAHNRLWFNRADQPGAFGFSQEYVNNVGLQFSPDLGGTLPLDAGDFRALSVMDEKVIFLTSQKLFVVYGNGPTPSGGFNNYSDPQEIPTDVGCSDARSVLRTPGGIIFKALKGWYLLGRGLDVKYIGEGVATFDANPVSSAAMMDDRQEARFITTDGETTTTLVYSYSIGQWSYFQKTNGSSYSPIDGLYWPNAVSGGTGRYVHISLANGLNKDTPGIYSDAPGAQSAVGVAWRARTGFLRGGVLERFQRIRWLYLTATADAAPIGNLTIAVDFDDAYSSIAPGSYSFAFSLSVAFPAWAGMPIDIRHKLRRQKCKSVAFTFSSSSADGVGRIIGIQALAMELGFKRGSNKLSALQTVD